MDKAAANSHIEIVRWLHENHHEGCTQNVVDSAAENGYMEVVKYLYPYRQMNCSASVIANIDEQSRFSVCGFCRMTQSMEHTGQRHVSHGYFVMSLPAIR